MLSKIESNGKDPPGMSRGGGTMWKRLPQTKEAGS